MCRILSLITTIVVYDKFIIIKETIMHKSIIKITGFAVLALGLTVGSAYAGDGKKCDHKKKAAVTASQTAVIVTPQMTVLSDAQRVDTTQNKVRKTYSFDDALKLCQDKGATDLQACIDYKTGITQAKS